jgi:hypothetical protein
MLAGRAKSGSGLRDCDGKPVDENKPGANLGRNFCTRKNDSGEVQRIGRTYDYLLTLPLLASNATKRVDCFWQGVLLAGEAGYEPAAANDASSFHSTQRPKQVAPG